MVESEPAAPQADDPVRPHAPALQVARLALGFSLYHSPRREKAMLIVRRFSVYSVLTGAIPVPGVDLAALTAFQLRMLARIARIYDVPFTTKTGRIVAGALMLGVPQMLSQGVASGFLAVSPAAKFVPGPGTVVGQVAMAGFSATITYALGVVFIDHFESGGTILDFDTDAARISFQEEIARARVALASGGDRAARLFRRVMPAQPEPPPPAPSSHLVRRPRRRHVQPKRRWLL